MLFLLCSILVKPRPILRKSALFTFVYVRNENKFNKLAGLQSDNPPELLARVELVGDSLSDSSEESKPQMQMWHDYIREAGSPVENKIADVTESKQFKHLR